MKQVLISRNKMDDAWPSVPEFPFFLAFFRISFEPRSVAYKTRNYVKYLDTVGRRLLPVRKESTIKSSTVLSKNRVVLPSLFFASISYRDLFTKNTKIAALTLCRVYIRAYTRWRRRKKRREKESRIFFQLGIVRKKKRKNWKTTVPPGKKNFRENGRGIKCWGTNNCRASRQNIRRRRKK